MATDHRFSRQHLTLTAQFTQGIDAYAKKVLNLLTKNGKSGQNARDIYTCEVAAYPSERAYKQTDEAGNTKTVTRQFIAIDCEGKGVIFVYYEKYDCGTLIQGQIIRKLPRLDKNELEEFLKEKEEELVPVFE